MARAASVLANWRPGMSDDEAVSLHSRYGGLALDQARQAHQQARSFYQTRGRSTDEGELEDIYRGLSPAGFTPTPAQVAPSTPYPGLPQGQPAPARQPAAQPVAPAGGIGIGNLMPKLAGMSGQQLEYFQDQLGNFQRERQRVPDPGEIEDLIADARRRGGPPMTQGWGTPQPRRRMTPNPWQVNPMVWDSIGPIGQQLALGAAEEDGFDANDWLRQLNASRPQGLAPRRVRTQYALPRSSGFYGNTGVTGF